MPVFRLRFAFVRNAISAWLGIPVAALVGVLAGLWLPPPVSEHWLGVSGLLLVAGSWWFAGSRSLLCALALIVTWAQVCDYRADIRSVAAAPEQLLQGCVASIPRTVPEGQSFRFRLVPTGSMVQLRTYNDSYRVAAGECHALRVRLKPPHGQVNRGQFDRAVWLLREHVVATGYVRDSALNTAISIAGDAPRDSLLTLRARLGETLAELLHGRPEVAVVQGLVLGIRTAITDEQWQVFRYTGTVHLMAISGLHVSVAAAAAWLLLRWLPLRTGSPLGLARVAAVGVALGYALLAGWPVPASRAALMLLVVAALTAGRRRGMALTGLAISLVVALLSDPFSVLGSGFWMSYLAVALLLTAPRPRYREPAVGAGAPRGIAARWSGVAQRYLGQLVTAQWRLTVGLALPALELFDGIAALASVVNIVVLPLFTLVLPLLLSATLLTFAHELCLPLLLGAGMLVQAGLTGIAAAEQQLGGGLSSPSGSWAAITLAAGCLLLLTRCPAQRFAGGVLAAGAWVLPDVSADPVMQVDVLDVGQGTAIVLRTAQHTVLFGCGAELAGWRCGRVGDRAVPAGRRVITTGPCYRVSCR